jgi:hypothetical protein
MDDEHVLALIETIHGTNLDAIHQFALDATVIDDIGQIRPPRLQFRGNDKPAQGEDLMDRLTFFGLLAVMAMLIFYTLEDRSPWFILAFAGACGLGSIYGFLQGAWPFGVIEAIWSTVAVWRWVKRKSI